MAQRPDVALAVAYTARYNRIRFASGVLVGRLWDRLANVDDMAAARFAEAAVVAAMAAQESTVAGVDGYVAALLGISPLGADTAETIGAAVRAGVDPLEVYHRPVVSARSALASGKTWSEAMKIGRLRAISTAETDVALAQRAAMAQHPRVVGYRRTLSGASCALCATASTQRYRSGDLMPIHARCDCGVAPIVGASDPGHVINRQLVKDLKVATPTGDYARNRHVIIDEDGTVRLPEVKIREHGELGPVLTQAGDDFTGPSDLAA